MSSLERPLHPLFFDHAQAAGGPVAAFAFFDVDQTLISIKSMFSFQEYWYAQTGDEPGRRAFLDEMARLRAAKASREMQNRRYYAHFAGRSMAVVEEMAARWFADLEVSTRELFHPAVVAALFRHQELGREPVLVSGSFPALLEPIAARLGVHRVLATRMEVADGHCTGEILPPQTIGRGKAAAIAAFLGHTSVPASHCYAYGDDISDEAMLLAVGWPTVVRGGSAELEAAASARGWPVISPY